MPRPLTDGDQRVGRRSGRRWIDAENGRWMVVVGDSDTLSVRARKLIFGGFAWVFTGGAALRLAYGDIPFALFLGVFAVAAFCLRWVTGKWWAELDWPPPGRSSSG